MGRVQRNTNSINAYGFHTESPDSFIATENNHPFAPDFASIGGFDGGSPNNFNAEFHGYYEPYVVDGYNLLDIDNLAKTGLPLPNFNGLKAGDVCIMQGLSDSILVNQAPAAALGLGSSVKYPHLFNTNVSPDADIDPTLNSVVPIDSTLGVPVPNRILVKVDKVQLGFMDFNPYDGQPLPYDMKAEPCTELTLTILAHQGTEDYNNNGHVGWYTLTKKQAVNSDFANSFLHFSYRYKYIDGEYSGLAPFSRPAFRSDADNGGLANRRLYIYIGN